MAIDAQVRRQLATRFEVLLPHLNERQQRLALATEARLLGHGGVQAVAEAGHVSATTVRTGIAELEAGEAPFPDGRARRRGAGRKKASERDPELVGALLALVEPHERGDPMSPLRWTTKSLRRLADELTIQGHPVSAPTVGKLLHENGFSLQGTAKTLEGSQHPDRDAQFRYLNEQVKAHQCEGEPVVSVDTKKKEQLGRLPAAGREWRPAGEPVQVEDHSFFSAARPDAAVAVPYGIYDLGSDSGWVNVGVDHDTSVFAVASIRRWWQARGALDYPDATKLLITADAGGSNSHRYRMWKAELAALAAETGLAITVCHFPPGTSKWNKIEHRLFSQITMNWRGRPLTSHEVVVATIAATRTRTGLAVHAELDTGSYPTGVAISKERFDALPLQRHSTHGTWNYTLHPPTTDTEAPPVGEQQGPASRRQDMLARLADPRLTGMSDTDLDQLSEAVASAQAARAQQRYAEQRGGRSRRATGNLRGTPLFDDAARVLITLIYLRQVCSMNVLADLLEVTGNCIGELVRETREVLEDHGHHHDIASIRFARSGDLLAFLDTDQRPARSAIIEVLSAPALTGMTRTELRELTKRLAARQSAQAERLAHQRRGGPRQPGTRGGVFPQKISNHERVLLTVLYQRKLCTLEVLADTLGDVSRTAVGGVVRETRPLLEQDGYLPAPATVRYGTTHELLSAGSPPDAPAQDTPTS